MLSAKRKSYCCCSDFFFLLLPLVGENPIGFVHGFVEGNWAIKQNSIFSKFCKSIKAIMKLWLPPFISSWRHRVSLDDAIIGQISNSYFSKSTRAIKIIFGVYLSWEKVYPKIAQGLGVHVGVGTADQRLSLPDKAIELQGHFDHH